MEKEDKVTSYTFINGLIPTTNNLEDIVDFEDFVSPNPSRISLEPSAYGPTIVIRGTEESNIYTFRSPSDMMTNHPDIFDEYIRYLSLWN